MKTLVLLSGGLDSAVVLALMIDAGRECEAVGYDYGQPHRVELEHAARVAAHYNVPFAIEYLPPRRLVNDVVFAGRNLIFAAHAIAHAQEHAFAAIAVGCNESDWRDFPDCRPLFWKSVEMAAQFYGVHVSTPLLHTWKGEVIKIARNLDVPIGLTWSCYEPRDGKPCGRCLACRTRANAMEAVVQSGGDD